MKNKLLLFASFIFMVFVSCDSSSIDESELAATSLSEKSKIFDLSEKSKNFKSKQVERDISNSIVATDTPPSGSTFVGKMTHLGEIHGVVTPTGFLDNGDGTFNFSSNDVLIAANGDELYTETKIVLTFSSALEATYVGGFTITGGTGRFVGATGYLTIPDGVYIINGVTGIGTSTHNAVGKITY